MKFKTISILALAISGTSYGVTTFNTTNGQAGSFALQVVDNAGAAVTNGSVEIGYFNGEATSLANFVSLGSAAFSTSVLGPGMFGTLGGSGIDINLKPGANDEALSEIVYAVIRNPAVSADDQFIAFTDGTNTFKVESIDVDGAAQSLFANEANLVYGEIVAGGTSGLGGPFTALNGSNAVTFGVIPEPSSALLAGLALVGGLVRRRR